MPVPVRRDRRKEDVLSEVRAAGTRSENVPLVSPVETGMESMVVVVAPIAVICSCYRGGSGEAEQRRSSFERKSEWSQSALLNAVVKSTTGSCQH